jgi:hypothetical protein
LDYLKEKLEALKTKSLIKVIANNRFLIDPIKILDEIIKKYKLNNDTKFKNLIKKAKKQVDLLKDENEEIEKNDLGKYLDNDYIK